MDNQQLADSVSDAVPATYEVEAVGVAAVAIRRGDLSAIVFGDGERYIVLRDADVPRSGAGTWCERRSLKGALAVVKGWLNPL